MDPLEKLQVALGLVITTRRLELGLTQNATAMKAEVERAYYGRLERGQTGHLTLAMLTRVAAALGTLPEVIIAEARARIGEVADDGSVEREILRAGRRPNNLG